MDLNRETALEVLNRIEKNGAYSNIELNTKISLMKPDAPAFVRELVYGVLKNRMLIDHYLNQLVKKDIAGLDVGVLNILRMGVFQIEYMEVVPEYAACNSSAELAKKFFGKKEVDFVNAVLRSYIRKKDDLYGPNEVKKAYKKLALKYSFAYWISKLWIETYGEEKSEKIMRALNESPKLSIKVNNLKTSQSELKGLLEKRGFEVKPRGEADILYVKGSGIAENEEYYAGLFYIQDAASAIAVSALFPCEGDSLIDVCSAPGGKSFDAAMLMKNQGKIRSFDFFEHKIKALDINAKKLGIDIIEAEILDAEKGNPQIYGTADKVICDVPCSGLGVIARKPEIKYKELNAYSEDLYDKQLNILEKSSKYLKNGGKIMYSTCTINHNENEDICEKFIKNNPEFKMIEKRQLLPDEDFTDGFFYAILLKG